MNSSAHSSRYQLLEIKQDCPPSWQTSSGRRISLVNAQAKPPAISLEEVLYSKLGEGKEKTRVDNALDLWFRYFVDDFGFRWNLASEQKSLTSSLRR